MSASMVAGPVWLSYFLWWFVLNSYGDQGSLNGVRVSFHGDRVSFVFVSIFMVTRAASMVTGSVPRWSAFMVAGLVWLCHFFVVIRFHSYVDQGSLDGDQVSFHGDQVSLYGDRVSLVFV